MVLDNLNQTHRINHKWDKKLTLLEIDLELSEDGNPTGMVEMSFGNMIAEDDKIRKYIFMLSLSKASVSQEL